MKILKKLNHRLVTFFLILCVVYFVFNAVKICRFSTTYNENISDVAIILGAGTKDGKISPIFRERLNHGIYLIKNDVVKSIILTGGFGAAQSKADSEVAREYLILNEISANNIFIEKKSKYTIENLIEAKKIMDSLDLKTALLVSDPLHMKRSIDMAEKINITCTSSPTRSTMYKSFRPKFKSLMYETFFYTLGEIIGKN